MEENECKGISSSTNGTWDMTKTLGKYAWNNC